MDALSNTISYSTLTADYPAVKIPSGTAAGVATPIVAGSAHASVILDLLFRNLDTGNARLFDVILCQTGSQATAENNLVQVSIPANAGNNGAVSVASLATLAPLIFDLDMASNRVITLESGWSIYLVNKAALTADMYVRVKRRNF